MTKEETRKQYKKDWYERNKNRDNLLKEQYGQVYKIYNHNNINWLNVYLLFGKVWSVRKKIYRPH